MPVDALRARLEEVIKREASHAFLLTGFYLAQEEVEALRGELTPDTPPVGAIGRYRTVPVFPEEAASQQGSRKIYVTHGIKYTYFKMDVVN